MRELTSSESNHTAGGGIRIGANGSVSHTGGKTTLYRDGSIQIRTNDGWTYTANTQGHFSLTNGAGKLIDSTMLRWLKSS